MKVLTWSNKIYNIFIIINFRNIWKIVYDGVYWSTILVAYVYSILKCFSTCLKQYKLNFNHSFQHLQFVISIVQNNFGRLFLHYFFITSTIHSPQILIHSWKIKSMVKIIVTEYDQCFFMNFTLLIFILKIEHIKNL
jgi:hypothetical protein